MGFCFFICFGEDKVKELAKFYPTLSLHFSLLFFKHMNLDKSVEVFNACLRSQ